jgi:hypothetical protein
MPTSPQENEKARRKRTIRVLVILGIFAAGIFYMSWKEMSTDIPAFDELKVVNANSFRPEISKDHPIYHAGMFVIEFYDNAGMRYQTPAMSPESIEKIQFALKNNIPVQLRYGRWNTAIKSSNIFTVYQLTAGNEIIVPYGRLAEAKKKEQEGKYYVIIISIIVISLASFLGVKLGNKIHKNFP